MPTSIWLDWPECQRRSCAQSSVCQHRGMKANAEAKTKRSSNRGVQPPPLPSPIQHHWGRRWEGKGCFPASSCRLGQAAARLPAKQLSLHRAKFQLNSPMGSMYQGGRRSLSKEPRVGRSKGPAFTLPCRSLCFLSYMLNFNLSPYDSHSEGPAGRWRQPSLLTSRLPKALCLLLSPRFSNLDLHPERNVKNAGWPVPSLSFPSEQGVSAAG